MMNASMDAPAWLDSGEYPFTSRYFTANRQRLHYIDTGEGEPFLFVHGAPSWSFDFRHVIQSLSAHYRCIAADHIGFGLSDKPENYDYSTPNHSATLERFIGRLGLRDITLVLHDFGGPIGFDYALRHPDNVKRIVVINSWLWSSKNDPDFIRFSKILNSPFLPFLYRRLNFSPRFLLPRSFGEKKISKHILKHYTRPFRNAAERNGALAFARSLLHDQDWFEALWAKKEALTDKPMLLIWGMKDNFVKPAYLEKFLTGFPRAKAIRLENCGHFPQEEEPGAVARGILKYFG